MDCPDIEPPKNDFDCAKGQHQVPSKITLSMDREAGTVTFNFGGLVTFALTKEQALQLGQGIIDNALKL